MNGMRRCVKDVTATGSSPSGREGERFFRPATDAINHPSRQPDYDVKKLGLKGSRAILLRFRTIRLGNPDLKFCRELGAIYRG